MSVIVKINEILGSVAVLFLFFSGVAIAFMLIGSVFIQRIKRRGKQSGYIKSNTNVNRVKQRKQRDTTERSPFGSLCLALAGTLGVGNISGVASAIAVGGAGAVFWMWVSSLFCSALKYAEVVLAMHFRKKTVDGYYEGGAHLYIKNGLGLGLLASLFCILCVFSSYTVGNITQINAAAQSLRFSFGMNEQICGVVCCFLILFFCRNGSVIYSFTLRLIPFLCIGYIIISLAVVFSNVELLDDMMKLIVSSAFNLRSGIGGLIGVVCGRAFRIGITRGVMSNEAGCGTAPMAHASSNTHSYVMQGVLGIVEVLFDTLFLCTLTALVILISDVPLGGEFSTVNAISAFSSVIGEWVEAPLALAMLFFAIASAVGWNYYGRVSLSYLGAGKGALFMYLVSYAVCAFFGAGLSEGIIWELSDISIYMMSIINTASVLLLTGFLKKKQKRD